MEKGKVLTKEFIDVFAMIKQCRDFDPSQIKLIKEFMKKLYSFIQTIEAEKMAIVNKYVQKENVNGKEQIKFLKDAKGISTNRYDFGTNLDAFDKEFKILAETKIDIIPVKISFSQIKELKFSIDMFEIFEPFIQWNL